MELIQNKVNRIDTNIIKISTKSSPALTLTSRLDWPLLSPARGDLKVDPGTITELELELFSEFVRGVGTGEYSSSPSKEPNVYVL